MPFSSRLFALLAILALPLSVFAETATSPVVTTTLPAERPPLDYQRPDAVLATLPKGFAERLKADPDAELDAVAELLKVGAESEAHLAKRVHDWCCYVLRYDHEADAQDIRQQRGWETGLQSGKTVCGGYALLFQEMCRRVGLEAITVPGYARGSGFDAFARLENQAGPGEATRLVPNHAWNAVHCEGRWLLVDATWNDNQEGAYQARWLFPDPAVFITTHLPSDAQWQLLPEPVSATDFHRSALRRPDDWLQAQGIDLPLRLRERAPGEAHFDLPDPGADHYYLAKLSNASGDEHKSYLLAWHETGRRLHLRTPEAGEWLLTVFRVPRPGPDEPFGRTFSNKDLFSLPLQSTAANETAFVKRWQPTYELRCVVQEPIDYQLRAGGQYRFAFHTPVDAAFHFIDGVKREEVVRGEDGEHSLTATLGRGVGDVHIALRTGKDTFTPILSWRKVRKK